MSVSKSAPNMVRAAASVLRATRLFRAGDGAIPTNSALHEFVGCRIGLELRIAWIAELSVEDECPQTPITSERVNRMAASTSSAVPFERAECCLKAKSTEAEKVLQNR
jgi:hypothetical protein